MNVLFLYVATETVEMLVLPLGLASLAAAVQAAGHDFDLVTLNSGDDVASVLSRRIDDFRPDLIGVSLRNVDNQSMQHGMFFLPPVKEAIDVCRSLSRAPIVAGGAGFSIYPQSALHYLGADYGIAGEGESAFVMLLDRLSRGEDLRGVPGLCVPGCNTAPATTHESILDACPLPLPDVHLRTPAGSDKESIWIPIQTRRGCPMACSYCSTASIEGTKTRRRSPGKVVENLARFVAAGYRNFFFVDNTFNFPPTYASALCDAIVAAGLDIHFQCILYPYKVDEDLVRKMADAGCRGVSLGFESGAPEILKNLNKRFVPSDVIRISNLLKSSGIGRMGFLLLGGPGETRATVTTSLQFAASLELELVKVSQGIRIYPKTVLENVARAQGVLRPGEDLLLPRYYLVDELKDWMEDAVARYASGLPNWMV